MTSVHENNFASIDASVCDHDESTWMVQGSQNLYQQDLGLLELGLEFKVSCHTEKLQRTVNVEKALSKQGSPFLHSRISWLMYLELYFLFLK